MSISELLLKNSKVDPLLAHLFESDDHSDVDDSVVIGRRVEGDGDKLDLPDSPTEICSAQDCDEDVQGKKSSPKQKDPAITGAQRRISKSTNKESSARLERTIFVGNLPTDVTLTKNMRKLKREFSQFGEIESVRCRSLPRDLSIPFKKAIVKKVFQKGINSLNAYIVYKEVTSAQKALEHNGHVLFDRHIRVDTSTGTNKNSHSSIFVGGLPFTVTEEALYNLFSPIGEISYIRVPRDNATKAGRGVAYVCFKQRSNALSATKLNGSKFENREIRVSVCRKPRKSSTSSSFTNRGGKLGSHISDSKVHPYKKFDISAVEGLRAKKSKVLSRKILKSAKRVKKRRAG